MYLRSSSNFYALDASTGILKSKFPTKGEHYTFSDGAIYVGSWDNVYALDAATGSFKWNYETGVSAVSSPAVTSGVVYVGLGDGNLYALDAATGSFKWKYETDGVSSIAVSNNIVYVIGYSNFYALNASTGTLKWESEVAHDGSPVISGEVVYVAQRFKFYALDSATGALKWNYTNEFKEDFFSPIVADGMVYVGSRDGNLYAFAPQKTGSIFITSSPAGARIYLDENYKGTTDKKITNVTAGSYIIKLELNGYESWSQTINVVAGQTSYISPRLVSEKSKRLATPYTTATITPEDSGEWKGILIAAVLATLLIISFLYKKRAGKQLIPSNCPICGAKALEGDSYCRECGVTLR